ncbi:MAG: malto-oligosyltrehalose synthase [Myxococcaceae bacterium]
MVDDAQRAARALFERVSQRTPNVPTSTYRLHVVVPHDMGGPYGQHPGLSFEEAAEALPYLRRMGFGAAYLNPPFESIQGRHGYDNVGQEAFHPLLGRPEVFFEALKANGLGLLLDIVPHHQGIEFARNPFWNDVLKLGRASPYAQDFDIDWAGDPNEHMDGRVLIPVLGDAYGNVLARGELNLKRRGGELRVCYYDHEFPIGPTGCAEVVARWAGKLRDKGFAPEALELETVALQIQAAFQPEIAPHGLSDVQRGQRQVLGKALEGVVERLCREAPREELLVETFAGYRGRAVPAGAEEQERRRCQATWASLDQLLQGHCAFELSDWKNACAKINYGRFFDINGLARIRTELPQVFQRTHRLVREVMSKMADAGLPAGVRIDHPDGLYDPDEYFQRLQEAFFLDLCRAELRRSGAPEDPQVDEESLLHLWHGLNEQRFPLLVVLAEKILERDERLPERWKTSISGTTGYDAMFRLGEVFIKRSGEALVTQIYDQVRGAAAAATVAECVSRTKGEFHAQALEARRLIVDTAMLSQVNQLARELKRIAQLDVDTKGYSYTDIQRTLAAIVVHFDVYRTYLSGERTPEDAATMRRAISRANKTLQHLPGALREWVANVLLLRIPAEYPAGQQQMWREFVQHFQQLTGPVTAKAVEDTLFFRYNRLIGLNEVGGDPLTFGISSSEFHEFCKWVSQNWPHTASALSTHDTKMSAAARTRLNVIAERPAAWADCVLGQWLPRHETRGDFVTPAGHVLRMDRNDMYRVYQAAVAIWEPARWGSLSAEGQQARVERAKERVRGYIVKSLHEAKLHTSWVAPNNDYVRAAESFVNVVFGDPEFVRELRQFVARNQIAEWSDSLGQRVLQFGMPGVPDTYQGDEVGPHRLVDPDNRQQVDFEGLLKSLDAIEAGLQGADRERLPRELWRAQSNGRASLFVIRQLSWLRKLNPDLYFGAYDDLRVEGARRQQVVGLVRRHGAAHALHVVSRFPRTMQDEVRAARRRWNRADKAHRLGQGPAPEGPRPPASSLEIPGHAFRGTRIHLPPELAGRKLTEVFSGRTFVAPHGRDPFIDLGDLFRDFPHAVLVSDDVQVG